MPTKTNGLGRIPVEPVISGRWPFQGFPLQFTLAEPDGTTRTFALARWKWPLYSGVVQQYRETVPFNAQHLLVYADGSYDIEHLDEANPDEGFVFEHALLDMGEVVAAGCAVLGLGVGLVLGLYLFGDES